jgi:hypothetical protein
LTSTAQKLVEGQAMALNVGVLVGGTSSTYAGVDHLIVLGGCAAA